MEVGMEDRGCVLDQIYAGVESLMAQMKRKEVTTIFVVVTVPPNLTPKEQAGLKVLKRAVKLRFEDKFWTSDYPAIKDTDTEGA